MDKYQSIRVTVVPRKTKHHAQPQVVPISSKHPYDDTRIQSTSRITPWTMSTSFSVIPSTVVPSIRSMTNETHGSKTLSSFDVIERSAKKSIKDVRRENKDKKKKLPKAWVKTIVIIIVLLILSAVAVGIYLTIRFTTKTTSTTTVTTPALRWQSTGVTVAGIGGSPGSNASQLNVPVDLALDRFNALYIADFSNNRIQKWIIGSSNATTVAGQVNASWSNDSAYLYSPGGVYLDSNDNIYVSDTYNNRVQLWANGASVGTTIAGT